MDYDEYEALPQNSTVLTHMLAGAAAGIMEHSCMYPVDSVKTRMQSLVSYKLYEGKSLYQCLKHIAKTEGFWRPVRGLNVVVVGAGPAHALYFSSYEALKKILVIPNTPQPSNQGNNRPDLKNVLAHGVAGMAATLLHDAIMNPVEVVKQRLQTLNSPYTTSAQCFMGVLRREGFRAFYRSYPTQVTLNVPFQCTHFITYELGQDVLNRNRAYNLPAHLLSGAIAGGLAAAITTPLDVCKTLLNTQEITCDLAGVACSRASKSNNRGTPSPLDSLKASSSSHKGNKEIATSAHNFASSPRTLPNHSNNNNSSPSRLKPSLFPFMKMGVTVLSTRSTARSPQPNNNSNNHSYSVVRGLIQAAKTVYRVRGPPGFFQGLQARVVYQMPATALSWSVYEFFKFALTKQNGDDSGK